ncbi:MAG: septum formation initiator family protein [Paracoccaceae bacterium]|nr:septum formation initiator family protein [Paracoccaceae bacterium]
MGSGVNRPGLGLVIYFAIMFSLGVYFMFASVQGDFGLFRRVQIEAELAALKDERARLADEVGRLENKTRRLSDTYLDLDLLDNQARDVLGLVRSDEIVLH